MYGRCLTSEVFHFQIFRARLLAQQRVIKHDFGLALDAFIKLAHGHVAQALHVLAHFIVRFQLKAVL